MKFSERVRERVREESEAEKRLMDKLGSGGYQPTDNGAVASPPHGGTGTVKPASVARFDICDEWECAWMKECPDGRYVEFFDYRSALDMLRAAIDVAARQTARVAELDALIPRWVNTHDLTDEYRRLVESGWTCCSACSHYAPDGAWMTLMVPPIPLPSQEESVG